MHAGSFITADSGVPSAGVVDDSQETGPPVDTGPSSLDDTPGTATSWGTLQRGATGDTVALSPVPTTARPLSNVVTEP